MLPRNWLPKDRFHSNGIEIRVLSAPYNYKIMPAPVVDSGDGGGEKDNNSHKKK